MSKIFLALIFITGLNLLYSQEVKTTKAPSHIDFKAVGSINISIHPHKGTSQSSLFINFGGPGIRLEHGIYGISFNMFPSIRYYNKKFTPILGAGMQISYRKISVVAPMYYVLSPRTKNNIWIISFGLGYKF